MEIILDFLFDIRNFFIDFFSVYLIYFKLASFLISGILLILIVYLIIKTNFITFGIDKFIGDVSMERLYKRRSIKGWQQIRGRLEKGNEAELKLALIEADKILDEVIKMIGYRGDTMADRLKQITPAELSSIGDIWNVHKLRNRVVHETDFMVTKHDIEKAISIYEKTFKEMGLLD